MSKYISGIKGNNFSVGSAAVVASTYTIPGVYSGLNAGGDSVIEMSATAATNVSTIDFSVVNVDFNGRIQYDHTAQSLRFFSNASGTAKLLVNSADVTSSARLLVTNNTASSSASTGAAVITGGLGVGGSLFGNAITADGTLTANSGFTVQTGPGYFAGQVLISAQFLSIGVYAGVQSNSTTGSLLHLVSNASNSSIIKFSANGLSTLLGQISYSNSTDVMTFTVGGTARMTINATGNILDVTGAFRATGLVSANLGLTVTGATTSVTSLTASALISANLGLTVTGATTSVTTLTASGLVTTTNALGLSLTNGTNNYINFSAVGASSPSATGVSVGTKLVLFPGGGNIDYAIGIEGSNMWFSSGFGSTEGFKFYANTTDSNNPTVRILNTPTAIHGTFSVIQANATSVIRGTAESNTVIQYFGTPFNTATSGNRGAIICAGITSWSRMKMHFCLYPTADNNEANATVSNAVMTLIPDGSVGIGTTSPSFKLDVTGTIRATGLISANLGLTVTGANTSVTTLSASGLITANAGLTLTGGATFSGAGADYTFTSAVGTQIGDVINVQTVQIIGQDIGQITLNNNAAPDQFVLQAGFATGSWLIGSSTSSQFFNHLSKTRIYRDGFSAGNYTANHPFQIEHTSGVPRAIQMGYDHVTDTGYIQSMDNTNALKPLLIRTSGVTSTGLLTASGGLTSTAGATILGASTIGAITGTSASFSSTLSASGVITANAGITTNNVSNIMNLPTSGSLTVSGINSLISLEQSGSNFLQFACVSTAGFFASNSLAGDSVIRADSTHRLLLLSGSGASAITINTSNNVTVGSGGLTSTAGSTTLGASTIGAITGTSASFSSTLTASGLITANAGITMASAQSIIFPADLLKRRVVLYNTNVNDHQFIGLGIESGSLTLQADSSTTAFSFKYATSSSASNTIMTILGSTGVTVTNGFPLIAGTSGITSAGLISANLGLTVTGATTSVTSLTASALITASGGLTSTAGSTILGVSTIGAITGTSASFSSILSATGLITASAGLSAIGLITATVNTTGFTGVPGAISAVNSNVNPNTSMSILGPNMTTNNSIGINFGKSSVLTSNSAFLSYLWVGDNNNANAWSLSHFGQNALGNLTTTNAGIFTFNGLSVNINNSTSTTDVNTFTSLIGSLANGNRNNMIVGKAFGTNNSATYRYFHVGDLSTSNYTTIGFFNTDDILNIVATERVGIGRTAQAPTAKLHIINTTATSGGSGDFTNITGNVLTLSDTSGGVMRINYLNTDGTNSTVYNYQSGKHVYWGEPTDTGSYIFRGRTMTTTAITASGLITANAGITMASAQSIIFPADLLKRRVVLYNTNVNDHQFIGLGIESGSLTLQADSSTTAFSFKYATSSSASNTIMTILGSTGVTVTNGFPLIAGTSGITSAGLVTASAGLTIASGQRISFTAQGAGNEINWGNGNTRIVDDANLRICTDDTIYFQTGSNSLSYGTERVRIDAGGLLVASFGISTTNALGLSLTNGTNNYINFNTAGTSSPSATGVSAGTKLVLYPSGGGIDYAIGIEGFNMWFSSPSNFKFYANTTDINNPTVQIVDGGGIISRASTGSSFTGVTTTSTGSQLLASFLQPNLNPFGFVNYKTFGISQSNNRCVTELFTSFSDGGSNNCYGIGLWGSDNTLVVNGNSFVGIGIIIPSTRLHVSGAGNTTITAESTSGYPIRNHLSTDSTVSTVYNYQSGKNAYWGEDADTGRYIFRGRMIEATGSRTYNGGYGFLNSGGNVGTSNGDSPLSIKATNRIAASEFNAVSDRRIKSNITNIENSLSTIRQITPRHFNYIDRITKGDRLKFGFIGQELISVNVNLSSHLRDYIPNIYQKGVVTGGIIVCQNMITFDFNSNGNIKLYDIDNKEKVVTLKEKISDYSFSVNETLENAEYFVFGEEVTDFHIVDEAGVGALTTAAVKELDTIITEQQITIQSQTIQIQAQQQKIDLLENFIKSKFSDFATHSMS